MLSELNSMERNLEDHLLDGLKQKVVLRECFLLFKTIVMKLVSDNSVGDFFEV
mgnify:CR=1 FL=1